MFVALAPETMLQNRYRIISRLDSPNSEGQGKGAMGAVYLAEDLTLSCEVAIKQLVFDSDADMAKAFHREAKLLSNLRHSALPRVTNHFTEGDGQFLVMDLIRGDDLDDLRVRHGGRLPIELALNLAAQLLEVLAYLHTQQPPVGHRDIKPSNLKLTQAGQLMLLDFGIAKGTAGLMTRYSGSIQALTPAYAPPEQLEAEGTEVRSDLYSFGATFYNLLTGITPPHALAVRAFQIAKGKPDPLRPAHELNSEVPVAISEILTQLLSLDIEKRPASAEVLRQELKGEKVSTGETTVRRVLSPVTAKAKAKMNWLYFAVPTVMLLLFVIIGGNYWRLSNNGPRYRLQASQPPSGRSLYSDKTFQMGPNTLVVTGILGTVNGVQTITSKQVSETQVLAPDRVKITYITDKSDTEMEIGGEKTSKSERREFDGVTLVGARSRNEWNFVLETGIPTDLQKKKIGEFARNYSLTDNDYYPEREVTVGETWTAAPSAVRRVIGSDILSAQGTITMTLRAVVPCGPQQCARIDIVIEVTAKLLNEDNQEMEIQIGGTGSSLRGLTSFVDEEGVFTGQVFGKRDFLVNGKKMHLESRGPVTIKTTTTVR